MKDRMKDLSRKGQHQVDDLDQIEFEEALQDQDLENQSGGYKNGKLIPEDSLFLNDFQSEVNSIREHIDRIETSTEDLRRLYKKLESSTQSDKKTKALKQETKELEQQLQKDLSQTKKALNKMGDENKKLHAEKPNCSEVRIRQNQHASLAEDFFSAMTVYNDVQVAHKEQSKENLIRLVKVAVGDEMSEKEIKQKVESGEIQLENVFSKRLDVADGYTIQATYSQIKETHDDLARLEESMEELHEMFQDMHALLQMQGELLDSIEHNVERSISYVESGISNLKTARSLASKSRVCACSYMVIIGLVAGGVAVLVLAVTGGVLGGVLPKVLGGK